MTKRVNRFACSAHFFLASGTVDDLIIATILGAGRSNFVLSDRCCRGMSLGGDFLVGRIVTAAAGLVCRPTNCCTARSFRLVVDIIMPQRWDDFLLDFVVASCAVAAFSQAGLRAGCRNSSIDDKSVTGIHFKIRTIAIPTRAFVQRIPQCITWRNDRINQHMFAEQIVPECIPRSPIQLAAIACKRAPLCPRYVTAQAFRIVTICSHAVKGFLTDARLCAQESNTFQARAVPKRVIFDSVDCLGNSIPPSKLCRADIQRRLFPIH